MNSNSKAQVATREISRPRSAEQRLKELGIKLPAPLEPFGSYVEAVQTGDLLFLSGMLPMEGHAATFIGRVARNSMWKGGARRLALLVSTCSLSRDSIWDR